MTTPSYARIFMLGLLAATLTGFLGCGTASNENPSAQNSAGAEGRNASLRRSIDIVGIWLGQASLDRPALDKHLETVTDLNERMRIERMADTFESISIAMDFRSDSTMEIEVEILPPDEAPFRRSSLGRYQIVSCDDQNITLQCSEEVEPGQVEEQTLVYTFSPDKNHLTTVAPVGDELKPFQPRFEFQRCDETQVAEQPEDAATILR